MSAFFNTGLRSAFILTVAFGNIVALGQSTEAARKNDALAVSLKMQTEQIQIGQTPWAIVTVYNITDQPLTMHASMIRVYVYGKDGEAPTTLVERVLTGRLRPGDVDLRTDEWPGSIETVWPAGGAGDSWDRRFDLAYLYDLSAPGKYTAYAEVTDPSSHRWLRTKTVAFEMTASAQ